MPSHCTEFYKTTIAMVLITANIVFGTISAKANSVVTLYFYSDSPVAFDLQKVAQKSSETLRKEGVEIISIEKVNKQSLPTLLSNFSEGESAKLKIKVEPGITIQGSPLSSYPATVTIDVIGIDSASAIARISKSARSQHTNPASGLTNAVRIALGPALKELSGQLHDLEPWTKKSAPVIAPRRNVQQSNNTPTSSENGPKQIVQIPNAGARFVPTSEANKASCGNKSVAPYALKAFPEALKPGNRVRIISCYTISGSKQTAVATISTMINSPFGETIKIKEDAVEVTSGYWKAEFDMKIPGKFTPGIYTLTQVISHDGRSETLEKKLIIN